MSRGRFAIVLPARYLSSRFPGKPLAVIAGKPLIEWVYRRAENVRGADRVVVATDHEQIASVVRGFGGTAVMTSTDHKSGTDRVAEVAKSLPLECIVNLQGDEPIFPPRLIEDMMALLDAEPSTDVVTACHPITNPADMNNPNVVKLVVDRANRALYFSRAPIPHGSRLGRPTRRAAGSPAYRHIGVYAYRKTSLLRFAGAPRTPLEIAEGLEQLRALELGMTIRVVFSNVLTVGVDVPEDIKTVEKALVST